MADYIAQYRDLPSTLEAMKKYNPGSDYYIHCEKDREGRLRFQRAVFVHGGMVKICKKLGMRVYCLDAAFSSSDKIVQNVYILTGNPLKIRVTYLYPFLTASLSFSGR